VFEGLTDGLRSWRDLPETSEAGQVKLFSGRRCAADRGRVRPGTETPAFCHFLVE
jgi:hypothetical protein